MAKKRCFVIAPIGEASSDTRKRSDQILKHVVAPAVDACGYEKPVRADQIAEPGMITSQVIQHIVDDELVIADLTERNPNVFYELAVRHAVRRPLVQMIRKGDQIPFDVAGARTVFVDHKDLDSVEAAIEEISNQIRALEKDPSKLETPISVSLDLQLLKQSENPEERSLGDVLTSLSELRSVITVMQKKLDDPTELLPPGYFREIAMRGRMGGLHPGMLHEMYDLLNELRLDEEPSTPKKRKERLTAISRVCEYIEHAMRRGDIF